MSNIFVYNSLSGKKEKFISITKNEIKMYVCGPTVYASAHIGHALSAMTFDLIRRYFEYQKYQVKFIMNFTDVDDKIIIKAKEQNISIDELTEKLMQEYLYQLQKLNIKPATKYPKATEEIDDMISFISTLIKKDFAYNVDGNVYFRTKKSLEYGKLSKRNLDKQKKKISINNKEASEDFALWKKAKNSEPFWESPWGKGRPGWHIECSAMCVHHLGEQIDIHGGGNDLVFPHHENEIAQSEAFTNKKFANYWMHNGMLELKGAKMSKSSGTLISIDDFLEKYDANTFRMMLISSHYRKPLAFSFDLAKEANTKVDKVKNALKLAWGDNKDELIRIKIIARTNEFEDEFHKSLNDDFNTPSFVKALFSFTKYINQLKENEYHQNLVNIAQKKLAYVLDILGFKLEVLPKENSSDFDELMELVLEIRKKLKKNENWKLADLIREKLLVLNIEIKDKKKDKTLWERK